MTDKNEKNTATPSQGGLRYNSGKLRWSLLSIPALRELGNVLEFGAKKYASWNWSNGLSWTDTYDSLQRHLQAWLTGEDRDPETGLSHIAHVMCNAMFLLHFIITRTGKDDRPPAQRVPVNTKESKDIGPERVSVTTIQDAANPVVDSGLSDVQANVRKEDGSHAVKFIHADDTGEWWYLADGRVGRYDFAGNRIG